VFRELAERQHGVVTWRQLTKLGLTEGVIKSRLAADRSRGPEAAPGKRPRRGQARRLYWPKERLIVEADSYDYHADRPAFERDHQSTVDLEVAGYRVRRTTYKMLQSNPGLFLRLVRAALAS
jgi:hypothetical protein